MAAFNYIKFNYNCPCCDNSVDIIAQTHIASDYHGDSTGHFMGRTYSLGDKMAWYLPCDGEFDDWMTWGKPKNGELVCERCYADCDSCHCELTVLIEFKNLVPVKVSKIERLSK